MTVIVSQSTIMDIVLDVVDTFAFDRLYATVLPANKPANDELLATYNQNVGRYVALQPSRWALLSSWPRDDIHRQALSLFLITWCVEPAYTSHARNGSTIIN